ncbi:Apoptotic chromatin condensation inducer in the nucleus [Phlyctochytrium bullatum]|nr:Apoptotic chromatin condensation inducer in the nucleus [Phlyctochytrium bullatum]
MFVAELKDELVKRKIDCKHLRVKKDLLARLEEAIRAEGNDPATYLVGGGETNAEGDSSQPIAEEDGADGNGAEGAEAAPPKTPGRLARTRSSARTPASTRKAPPTLQKARSTRAKKSGEDIAEVDDEDKLPAKTPSKRSTRSQKDESKDEEDLVEGDAPQPEESPTSLSATGEKELPTDTLGAPAVLQAKEPAPATNHSEPPSPKRAPSVPKSPQKQVETKEADTAQKGPENGSGEALSAANRDELREERAQVQPRSMSPSKAPQPTEAAQPEKVDSLLFGIPEPASQPQEKALEVPAKSSIKAPSPEVRARSKSPATVARPTPADAAIPEKVDSSTAGVPEPALQPDEKTEMAHAVSPKKGHTPGAVVETDSKRPEVLNLDAASAAVSVAEAREHSNAKIIDESNDKKRKAEENKGSDQDKKTKVESMTLQTESTNTQLKDLKVTVPKISPTTSTTFASTSSTLVPTPSSVTPGGAGTPVSGDPNHPPTTTILINNLVRPLNERLMVAKLGESGEVEKFWIAKFKTHTFVTFKSIEAAAKAREDFNGKQYPPETGRIVAAFFVDAEEADKIIADADAKSASSARVPRAPPPEVPQPLNRFNGTRAGSSESLSIVGRSATAKGAGNAFKAALTGALASAGTPSRQLQEFRPAPPPKEVDLSAFKKTETGPHIYYKPLTDEEIQAKKDRGEPLFIFSDGHPEVANAERRPGPLGGGSMHPDRARLQRDDDRPRVGPGFFGRDRDFRDSRGPPPSVRGNWRRN